MTDPRHDLHSSKPVTPHSDSSGGMWSWITGSAVLLLIAIVLIAGWNKNSNTASSATMPPAATAGNAPLTRSTTPAKPAMPAPPQRDTQ